MTWRYGTIKTRAVQVETNVNPSAKQLYITILEIDTGLQMQSIWGVAPQDVV